MKDQSFVDKLSDIFVKLQLFSKNETEQLKKDFKNSDKESFDDFLLEEDLIDKEDLLQSLSEYYQIPYFDVVGFFFSHQLLTNFPKEFLLQNLIIPVDQDQKILRVVAANPELPDLRDKISKYTDYLIEFNIGIASDIIDAIEEYYDESYTYIHDITDVDDEGNPDLDKPIYPNDIIDREEKMIEEESEFIENEDFDNERD